MSIINLTQHAATTEQVAAGVRDVPENQRAELSALLTFDTIPSQGEITQRVDALVELADGQACAEAMIGGAPYLTAPLAVALKEAGIEPLYSFTRRDAVEQTQADGSVRKVAVFRHVGWVSA